MDLCFSGERLKSRSFSAVLLYGARMPREAAEQRRMQGRTIGSAVPTVSTSRYPAASIHLYSRLWLTLDQLSDRDGIDSAVEAQVVTFRLELLVLLDSCESARWRSLLKPEERLNLRSTLEDVLEVLAVDTLTPHVIGQAQNRLLDAVLAQVRLALLTG